MTFDSNKKKNQTGFSILEVIAVIVIVSLGMIGLLSLASQSIRAQRINKYNLVAAMLAQEGIELVRHARDTNWRSGAVGWQTVMANRVFALDYTGASSTISAVPAIDDPATILKINASNGFYEHGSGTDTNFRRLITIGNTSVASSTVTSWVRYTSGGSVFNYVAETELYDWN